MRDFNKFLAAIRVMLKLDHNMHENCKEGKGKNLWKVSGHRNSEKIKSQVDYFKSSLGNNQEVKISQKISKINIFKRTNRIILSNKQISKRWEETHKD